MTVSAGVLITSGWAFSAIVSSHLARRPGLLPALVPGAPSPPSLVLGTGQCPPVEALEAGGGERALLSQEGDPEGPLGTGRPLALARLAFLAWRANGALELTSRYSWKSMLMCREHRFGSLPVGAAGVGGEH